MSTNSLFPEDWGIQNTTDALESLTFPAIPDFPNSTPGKGGIPNYSSPFGSDSLFVEKESNPLLEYMISHTISEVFVRNSCFDKKANYALYITIKNKDISYEAVTKDIVLKTTKTAIDPYDLFFIFKKRNIWIDNKDISENQLTFLCEKTNPITLDLNESEKLLQLLKAQYKLSKQSDMEKQASKIAESLEPILSNPFYKEVKMQVNVEIYKDLALFKRSTQRIDNSNQFIPHATSQVYKASYSNTDQKSEVFLDITIDQKTGKITVKHEAAFAYLQEYEGKWDKEIKARGRDYKIKNIRAEVLADFESAETEHSFYQKFIQSSKALFNDKIAGYAEAVLATQKIAKHVWAEGTINQSVWYTPNEEHNQWPNYVQVDPFIGGLEDGIVDEIVGIPLAIKGVYEIVTEEEKRAALAGLFSKEGIKNLYEGLLNSAEETLNDQEKTEHFVGVASVNVISMMSGIGFIGKSKKIVDSAEEITNFTEQLTNPKVLGVLEDIRKSDIKNPKVFHAVEDFLRTIEPKTLDALADAPGFDVAIKEMSSQWTKFNGGKFVMEYASERVGKGKTLKFEIETLDRVRRYDIQIEELLPNGRKLIQNLELKNWIGFWGDSIKKQFTKDLSKMEKLGDVKWVFSKKGVNQSMDELRGNVIKNLKKADGSPIDELNVLFSGRDMDINIKKFESVFGRKVETAVELIDELNKPEIFKQIFEIVE